MNTRKEYELMEQHEEVGGLHIYPKVLRVGHRDILDLFDGPVVVQEKIDGSQISFGFIGGDLRIRSHHKALDLSASGMFYTAVQSIKAVEHLLVPGWTYHGEYLRTPRHNAIKYDRVPVGNIMLFDVWSDGSYGNPLSLEGMAAPLGFEAVSALLTNGPSSVAALSPLLGRRSALGGEMEGVVVKRYGDDGRHFIAGKMVSEKFKETASPKKQGPQGVTVGSVVETLCKALTTEARWEKAVQTLREKDELVNAEQDIGPLIRAAQEDVAAEERDYIIDSLWKAVWPVIRKSVAKGLPGWYKAKLMGDVVAPATSPVQDREG